MQRRGGEAAAELPTQELFLFEDFRLDRHGGGLFRRDAGGAFAPLAVGSRGLDILGVLVSRAGEVVSKGEIIAAVWPGTIVEDSNLTVQISALRRVVDRGRTQGSCIQTVPGRGYRFVGAVTQPVADAPSAPSPAEDPPLVISPPPIEASAPRSLAGPLFGAAAPTRRLVVILALDVAGYSRLMGADEEGTHERLKAHQRELVEPKIREHRGCIVKTTGDGMLVEFSSVVDAVRCAAEVQRGVIDREPQLSDDRRIKFRIGINLGDVIAEGGDIFGDGINVAARLAAIAAPGGICVSAVVRDQIRDKLPLLFNDLGEQRVKNIARPVQVHALRLEAIAHLPASSVPSTNLRRRRVISLSVAATVAAMLFVAAGAWRLWMIERITELQRFSAAASIPHSDVAPRLSIVVLPFANLSNDAAQQYFADGITEDLTAALSRIGQSFVISRNTASTYRNRLVNTRQIGSELGVRYVLEGSVRRSDSKVQVNVQLIDAERDAHLWAERFDFEMGDLFALQNAIMNRISFALTIELVAAEAARPTDHPDALDYFLRARAVIDKPKTRETYAEAIGLFDRALTLEPRAVETQSRLAIHLAGRVLAPMTDTAAADVARAESLAGQVLAASPRSAQSHFTKGMVLEAQKRLEEAFREDETAVTLNANHASAYAHMGYIKRSMGSPEEAIPLLEQAIRISPRDPDIGTWYEVIGQAHLLQSRIDAAVVWAEKARADNPARPSLHALLACAYALNGESERAAAELAEARRLSSDDRYSSISRFKSMASFRPKTLALYEPTYFVGLRKAGMPEE